MSYLLTRSQTLCMFFTDYIIHRNFWFSGDSDGAPGSFAFSLNQENKKDKLCEQEPSESHLSLEPGPRLYDILITLGE